tara:strand:+ start:106 stop:351 length:246 start_codon:yes stop_codon:yes gene_type:complete
MHTKLVSFCIFGIVKMSQKIIEKIWYLLSSGDSSGLKTKKPKPKPGFSERGAEWIRTTDSRIFSPMLYQLSYSTLFKEVQN